MKKIVRYVIIHYLLTMFNSNKEVKDDICRSRFALFINNIKRDIKRRWHHYREPSRIPIKALKALKHCGFIDKEKQNNDGYTRSMEINKATFMHHAKMPAGHLVSYTIKKVMTSNLTFGKTEEQLLNKSVSQQCTNTLLTDNCERKIKE